jgi:pyruvate/2-oxoacid:ferredoxin oxidoreductase alpha subunit
VFGYIAGLGGRDVTPEVLTEIYWKTKNSTAPIDESVWVGLVD